MIRDIAELLKAFADSEKAMLALQNIKHAPTIGDMYEGLTADILKKSLPDHLNLTVTKGFVWDGKDMLSGQIDCMLVQGSGIKIPYTDNYKWHVKDVIAVFEVKKNLFGKDFNDSYDHLNGISKIYSNWISIADGNQKMDISHTRRVFSQITGSALGESQKIAELPINLGLIFNTIIHEQFAPIRIVLGYNGFKSEHTLRDALIKFLGSKVSTQGYGAISLPQQIICGNASLVKFNGFPYYNPMSNDKWMIIGSSTDNPILILLELLWTRLSMISEMPELFGEDLDMENFSSLISVKPLERKDNPGQWGWMYYYDEVSKTDLEQPKSPVKWEPFELTGDQFVIVNSICAGEDVDITEAEYIKFVSSSGVSADQFTKDLISTSLVALDGNILRMTSLQCMCVIWSDGRYLAADDNTGRFSRWMSHELEQKKAR